MFHRTKRLAVMVLCVWGILASGPSGPGTTTSVWAGDLSIGFAELEAYAQTQSPLALILTQELVKLQAERDNALQWSNPELSYDHEEGENLREWQVTLRKSFVMPFSHSQRKEGWAAQVQAAEFGIEQATADLLAELKTGYVQLRLLDAFLAHLDQLNAIVTEASSTANARHQEGDISGIESHLIQYAALSLDANRRNAMQERGEMAALWRAKMGIVPGSEIDLVTTVLFQSVELAPASEYVTLLESRPGMRSRIVLQQALGKHASAARPDLVPGLDVFAGFKRYAPENDGFVAGVALSLPVFDRNAALSRKYAAQQRIAENQLDLFRTHTSGEIAALVNLINDAQQTLTSLAAQPNDSDSVMSILLYSYQDGRLTLDAFLNALQIEVSGFRDYYDQLKTYYRNIFRLEAITGTEIVSYAR